MERIKKAMEKARASANVAATPSVIRRPAADVQIETVDGSPPDLKITPLEPISLERYRIIAANKEEPHTVSFDMLRTQVLREMQRNGYRTLAVTSPLPDCGKTTVAINLALSVAQLIEQTVLLGDLDLRRPKICEYLGLHPDHDLSDFLNGSVPLESALIRLIIPRLMILPNTKAHRNAAEMLTMPEMRSLTERLKSDDSDYISIFDLPPLLATDDTIAFLPQADSVLLVVEDKATKKPDLKEALRLLEGTALLGVVLNKSDISLRSYY